MFAAANALACDTVVLNICLAGRADFPGCMLQVAHLVEEAVQAQVVLMSENRRDIHRDAKAGPDFGSVVYGSTQQALAFTPPADPLPACAAASGMLLAHQMCLAAVLLVALSSANL